MSKKSAWANDADILNEGKKYNSRSEFKQKSGSAYNAAWRKGLLKNLYPWIRNEWTNDALLQEGRKFKSRKEFSDKSNFAYNKARKNNLLDLLYSKKRPDWKTDESVLNEGRKFKSKIEFFQNSVGAYSAALRRNLIDLIDFPEKRISSDNDVIYVWKAIGQYYNGKCVYKIGTTSKRLGNRRIDRVSMLSGFDFELICIKQLKGKATKLEKKLHEFGEKPKYDGFGGCTEFRSLSDFDLKAVLLLIEKAV